MTIARINQCIECNNTLTVNGRCWNAACRLAGIDQGKAVRAHLKSYPPSEARETETQTKEVNDSNVSQIGERVRLQLRDKQRVVDMHEGEPLTLREAIGVRRGVAQEQLVFSFNRRPSDYEMQVLQFLTHMFLRGYNDADLRAQHEAEQEQAKEAESSPDVDDIMYALKKAYTLGITVNRYSVQFRDQIVRMYPELESFAPALLNSLVQKVTGLTLEQHFYNLQPR